MDPAKNPNKDDGGLSAIINQGPNTLLQPTTFCPSISPPPPPNTTSPAEDEDDNPSSKPVIFPPKGEHTHTFIFLHGRGDSGANFAPWLIHARHSYGGWQKNSLQEVLPGVKFVFPSSRRFPCEGMKGREMMQWFDISSLSDTWRKEENQLEGLRVSVRDVQALIREEMRVLPLHRIILGGLSQGCATALYSMLTFEAADLADDDKAPFAAMVGMSGWLPFYKSIQKGMQSSEKDTQAGSEATKLNGPSHVEKRIETLNELRKNIDLPQLASSDLSTLKTPVFIGHGAADLKVPPKNGKLAVATLRELGMEVKWCSYENFGHWIQEPDEVNDMIEFLKEKAEVEVVGTKEE